MASLVRGPGLRRHCSLPASDLSRVTAPLGLGVLLCSMGLLVPGATRSGAKLRGRVGSPWVTSLRPHPLCPHRPRQRGLRHSPGPVDSGPPRRSCRRPQRSQLASRRERRPPVRAQGWGVLGGPQGGPRGPQGLAWASMWELGQQDHGCLPQLTEGLILNFFIA